MGGDNTAKSAEKSQAAFTNTLQAAFAQQFGANQSTLNFLNGKLTSAVNNPQGFSPQMLAAATTQAIQGTATDYANAAKTINNQIVARGGSTLPSGVGAQIQAQLATGAANEESSNLTNLQIANAQQQQSNFWNAVSGLAGVAKLQDPLGYASSANQGAGEVGSLSQAYSPSEQSGLGGQFLSSLGKA